MRRRSRLTPSTRRYLRRRGRVLARRGGRELTYQGRPWMLPLLLVLVAAALTWTALIHHLQVGLPSAGLLVIAWIGYTLRLVRVVPAGPGGDGPYPPGGAGVREPRRPRPHAPAGAAAMPVDGDEPPERIVALG
jgi:hypothetical protein